MNEGVNGVAILLSTGCHYSGKIVVGNPVWASKSVSNEVFGIAASESVAVVAQYSVTEFVVIGERFTAG